MQKWVSVFGSAQAKVTLSVKETVIIRTVLYIYWLFYCSRYGLIQVICKDRYCCAVHWTYSFYRWPSMVLVYLGMQICVGKHFSEGFYHRHSCLILYHVPGFRYFFHYQSTYDQSHCSSHFSLLLIRDI